MSGEVKNLSMRQISYRVCKVDVLVIGDTVECSPMMGLYGEVKRCKKVIKIDITVQSHDGTIVVDMARGSVYLIYMNKKGCGQFIAPSVLLGL